MEMGKLSEFFKTHIVRRVKSAFVDDIDEWDAERIVNYAVAACKCDASNCFLSEMPKYDRPDENAENMPSKQRAYWSLVSALSAFRPSVDWRYIDRNLFIETMVDENIKDLKISKAVQLLGSLDFYGQQTLRTGMFGNLGIRQGLVKQLIEYICALDTLNQYWLRPYKLDGT